jgi:hypothetical protein
MHAYTLEIIVEARELALRIRKEEDGEAFRRSQQAVREAHERRLSTKEKIQSSNEARRSGCSAEASVQRSLIEFIKDLSKQSELEIIHERKR